MTGFWVHGVAGLGDGAARRLAQAHPEWRFTDGDDPPSDAAYEVLVRGRPSRDLVACSERLHTLVVPFAGVPPSTAALLAEFPQVQIRTLHYNAGPTAELALGLVLAAARALIPADRAMRQGDWTPRFIPPRPTMVLAGHTATVVGYGHVGRRVARGLDALGMHVCAVRARATSVTTDDIAEIHPLRDLRGLLSRSRVTVLAVPGGAETAGLLGPAEIACLPSPAVLVNVARASVVDEGALYRRLRDGDLAAGLDVWWEEATDEKRTTGIAASTYPFHDLPNVVLSPHRGGGDFIPEVYEHRLAHLDRLLTDLANQRRSPSGQPGPRVTAGS